MLVTPFPVLRACGRLLAAAMLAAALPAPGPALAQQTRPPAATGDTGLPQVLAAADAARLRHIFDLQAGGDIAGAAREAERLTDRRLLGHVLADRYLRPGASPGAAELQAWLALYADHPEARPVQALLGSLRPDEAGPSPDSPASLDAAPRDPEFDRLVRARAREGDAAGGLARIAEARGLTPAQAGRLRAELGLGLFRAGRDAEALRIAAEAARAGEASGLAAFAAGLAAWGAGQPETALPFFEHAARQEGATPALRAAAAFWTARAAVRARRPALYVPWMLQAAQAPRSFYGLVARRSLGIGARFAWEEAPADTGPVFAPLAEPAGGWRALALLQIGEPARAEAELRQLREQAGRNPALSRAMLALARQARLAGLAAQLAADAAEAPARDLARYPVPRLQPEGGYRIDPALLYAVALQESHFDAGAVSPAGARGLMQLMPATARFLTQDPGLGGEGARRLHDPALSLELGQRYLHHLARHEGIEGNLVRLLAAYNAGPGNLLKWLPAHGHREDPFLFIEAIPFEETRLYVQRVLAYSWIYASRFGLPAPSLEALAAGRFPRFAGPEQVTALLQGRERSLH